MEPAEDAAADEPAEEEAQLAARREENIKALLSNNLQVQRQPLLSKYLVIREGEQQLRKAFKSPAPGAPAQSNALRKRLLARKVFVPWGSNKPFTPLKLTPLPAAAADAADAALQQELLAAAAAAAEDAALPTGIEPLVLWDPAEAGLAAAAAAEADGEHAVVVDAMLTRWLRPHQREGVQFMFECVTGLRLAEGRGCILADDMGLGKTLQGIALMWTLLQQGSPALGGKPIAKRAIIVCPTSLVSNWDSECTKWLKGRCRTLALCESSRDDVIDAITRFVAPHSSYHCLIISYETFRLHAPRLTAPGSCDLLICDEAHRLKNDATLTNRALDSLPCRRRVLLSGTPMQNHLDEFFAMVDFCNPGVLGSPAEFRKRFEAPILAGREPGAAPDVAALGEARSGELSGLVNAFILRRTNKLLSDHLPPKVVQVVVCRLGELQRALRGFKVVQVVVCRLGELQQQLYEAFLLSNATRRLLAGSKATGVLSAITSLKKLCNHPKLIYDTLHSKAQVDGTVVEGFEGVGELFPPGLFDNGRPGRGEMALGWECLSGKMGFVAQLLAVLRATTDDKVVIVSNYTQTLDLFAALCRQRGYVHLRLDGSTSITKRQKLVGQLNAPGSKVFVFLLSSKAGGCGLNLVGANRLILFDPDWNPATDKQAAARVWRDGQRKRVYVYRLLTAGTIEEKVFQRQISKEGLQQVVDAAAAAPGALGAAQGQGASAGEGLAAEDGGKGGGKSNKGGQGASSMSLMSAEELRELFSLRPDVASDTYEVIRGGSERAAAVAAARDAAAAAAELGDRMIRFLLLQNRAGKTRLAKYYVPLGDHEKRKLEYDVHRLIVTRDPKHTNFAEFKTYKIVYRRYAGLFFSLGIDVSDNELGALEAIHLFVEILDHYFSNVCELDLVFNFHKVYLILDEFILGGEFEETSKKVILERLRELDSIEV
ncbi:hypothetical protein OEZ86_006099 [Tetradesmus obliquus]|nr:hypothetical protein OEZ86_006099 [Tetradesmus obliquus]